jgi:serine protease Do
MKGRQIFRLGAGLAAALAFAVLPGYATQQNSQARNPSRAPHEAPMPDFDQTPGVPFGDFSWLDDPFSLQDAEAEAGWLGVAIEDISADKAKELKLAATRGVLIQNVDPNGPAAKAGLKAGDVITDFNGQQLQGTAQFRRMVRETPPGRNVPITYWRDGKSQTMSVELASRRPPRSRIADGMPAMPRIPRELPGNFMVPRTPVLGIAAMDVSGQLGAYFSVPDGEGVLVTEVKENSPAGKGGLKAGDVITEVNAKRVHDLGELRAQLGENRDAKSVSLTLIRKGAKTSVTVEPEAPKPAQPRNQHMVGRHT